VRPGKKLALVRRRQREMILEGVAVGRDLVPLGEAAFEQAGHRERFPRRPEEGRRHPYVTQGVEQPGHADGFGIAAMGEAPEQGSVAGLRRLRPDAVHVHRDEKDPAHAPLPRQLDGSARQWRARSRSSTKRTPGTTFAAARKRSNTAIRAGVPEP
jgi:hypothetical protein